MPYIFDSDNVYGSRTAVIKGDLTETDVQELQRIQPIAMAMNGAYGWTGGGLELVGKVESVRQLDLLPYARTDIACLHELTSIARLYIGTNCIGTLDFQSLTSLKTFRFHDSARALRFVRMDVLTSLVEIEGNPSADMLKNFERVSSLKTLSISKPTFENLNWLYSFNLNALEINGASKLCDLAGLETQQNLDYLKFLGNRKFSNLDNMNKCPGIRYLMVDECRSITSLAPIISLKKLEMLSFSGDTKIEDGCISVLDGIERLKNVRFCDRKNYDRKSSSYGFDMKSFYEVGSRYFSG